VDLSYKVTNIFPVSIHSIIVNNYEEVKNTLIEYCYERRKNNLQGRQVSNAGGGWQSEYKRMTDMNSILDSTVANSIMNYLPIIRNTPFSVSGWLNINPPGAYNRMHNHPDCHLSGVFWIKAPDKSGNIVFEHPNLYNSFIESKTYKRKFKLENKIDHMYSCAPIDGKILIFPGYLNHEVEKNCSSEDRISYAFNVKFQTEF